LSVGAVAGIGGGGILTSVMIIISDVVSLKKRGTYQGIVGMVVAMSNSLGPLLGGIFSEKVSWRWCFVSPTVNLRRKYSYKHSISTFPSRVPQ
jgi:MFS family permease